MQTPLGDDLMEPLERQLARVRLSLTHANPPVFLDSPADQFVSDVKYAARVAVNLLDRERSQDAILRARDAVASSAYGCDYQCQSAVVQNRINHIVSHAITAYSIHMQGISEPLRPSQRLALQPEKQGPKAVAK